MLLKDAIFKMNTGDCFDSDKGALEMKPTGKLHYISGRKVPLTTENLNLEGEIIPAKPKVLSAKEMLSKMPDVNIDDYEMIVKYGEAMHKNGRMERDLEHGPFFEVLEQLFYYIRNPSAWEHYSENVSNAISAVREEIKNIKPLNPE